MRIEEEGAGAKRRLDVEPGSDGRPVYTWKVDGTERPFDAAGRTWLQSMLLQFVRGTGYAADERVVLILKRQGPEGDLRRDLPDPGGLREGDLLQEAARPPRAGGSRRRTGSPAGGAGGQIGLRAVQTLQRRGRVAAVDRIPVHRVRRGRGVHPVRLQAETGTHRPGEPRQAHPRHPGHGAAVGPRHRVRLRMRGAARRGGRKNPARRPRGVARLRRSGEHHRRRLRAPPGPLGGGQDREPPRSRSSD